MHPTGTKLACSISLKTRCWIGLCSLLLLPVGWTSSGSASSCHVSGRRWNRSSCRRVRADPSLPTETTARHDGARASCTRGTRMRLPWPRNWSGFASLHKSLCAPPSGQLRIEKPAPKLAQTNEVCERHVGLLLENHPLTGTPALEPFRLWCVQTARGPILTRLLRLLSFDLPRSRGGVK